MIGWLRRRWRVVVVDRRYTVHETFGPYRSRRHAERVAGAVLRRLQRNPGYGLHQTGRWSVTIARKAI